MKKTIIVLSNHPTWTYKLRGEVLQALVLAGYHVIVAVGDGPEVEKLNNMGCEHVSIPYERRSINPIKELKLFVAYRRLLLSVKPDAVMSYTIKPNLYGAYLCGKYRIPCLINITGLGSTLERPGLIQTFFLQLYKFVFRKANTIFFQNRYNQDLFKNNSIVRGNDVLLPGSGVNLKEYGPMAYPSLETIEFVFISRIMKAKGIEEYLNAAHYIRGKYPQTRFHICGFCDQDYMRMIEESVGIGDVIYHGMIEDTREIYQTTHCTVLPSWYSEGMNNVLLESAACARPIITTDRPGCGEIVDDGVNGYVVKAQDAEDLILQLEKFILLPNNAKIAMGLAGRQKVEQLFDRQIVVESYLQAINRIFE